MKSNRMFGILCILLEKEKVTAKDLAEYFEVSVRTIHRDLLDLSSAGFPVIAKQGIGGGVSLLPDFKYNKAAFDQEEMNVILAGIQGFASIDKDTKIKTLLAKLRLKHDDKMLLENDIIIDFASWSHNDTTLEKINRIRSAIANHRLIEMEYYGKRGLHHRTIEPYKLIFKQAHWYLSGYCMDKEEYRIFKVMRIAELRVSDEIFEERENYTVPALQSDFVSTDGMEVRVRIDRSLEFLAVDFFGSERITMREQDLLVDFQTKYPEWVIRTIAEFGNRAEILAPTSLREDLKKFLREALELYET